MGTIMNKGTLEYVITLFSLDIGIPLNVYHEKMSIIMMILGNSANFGKGKEHNFTQTPQPSFEIRLTTATKYTWCPRLVLMASVNLKI